eukprot:4976427-Amphidinium_carterae.1
MPLLARAETSRTGSPKRTREESAVVTLVCCLCFLCVRVSILAHSICALRETGAVRQDWLKRGAAFDRSEMESWTHAGTVCTFGAQAKPYKSLLR